jgi:hypothetical protein
MYPDFYKNVLVPTCIRFCNFKLYTDAFIESIIAVTLQTHVIFACVRCLQTPILMVVQGDPGIPESFTN